MLLVLLFALVLLPTTTAGSESPLATTSATTALAGSGETSLASSWLRSAGCACWWWCFSRAFWVEGRRCPWVTAAVAALTSCPPSSCPPSSASPSWSHLGSLPPLTLHGVRSFSCTTADAAFVAAAFAAFEFACNLPVFTLGNGMPLALITPHGGSGSDGGGGMRSTTKYEAVVTAGCCSKRFLPPTTLAVPAFVEAAARASDGPTPVLDTVSPGAAALSSLLSPLLIPRFVTCPVA